jgi:hypothetical protein
MRLPPGVPAAAEEEEEAVGGCRGGRCTGEGGVSRRVRPLSVAPLCAGGSADSTGTAVLCECCSLDAAACCNSACAAATAACACASAAEPEWGEGVCCEELEANADAKV